MQIEIIDSPTSTAPVHWRVKPTGCFALLNDAGTDVTPRGKKARAILAYLSAHRGLHIPRDRLMNLFWGDRGDSQARDSLRQSLVEIRRAAGSLVKTDREHVWIESELLTEDENELDGEAQLFDDLNHITSEFDAWLTAERERRRVQRWDKLQAKVEALLDQSRGAEAIPLIEQMSDLDPYNEDWLRLAMQAEFQASHPAGIETRFNEMAARLRRDLGILPSAESCELHDNLLAKLSGNPRPRLNSDAAAAPIPAVLHSAEHRSARKPIAVLFGAAAFVGALSLSHSATSTTSPAPKVAVLPFAASTGVDPALAEGLSDELLSQLTRVKELRVIGRTSAAQFRGATDLRRAGRSLGANYLVEGKVSGRGGEPRVLVSLVRVRDGSAVWARSFRGGGPNLQPIPGAIGNAVARSLSVAASPLGQRTENSHAYALYLRAKTLMRNRDHDSLARAVELLREAVRADPDFAAAWAQLGGASRLAGEPEIVLDPGSPRPQTISIRDAVQRAVRLDPNLAEAHAMMALVEPFGSPSARAHLRRALQLDSGDTQTLYWWGNHLLLRGEFDGARGNLHRVAALDPLWKLPVMEAVRSSIAEGDDASAERYLRTLRLGNPEAAAEVEVFAAAERGDYSRAVELGLANRSQSLDFGSGRILELLITLDFRKQAMLMLQFGPAAQSLAAGQAPELPIIFEFLEAKAAVGYYPWFSYFLWQLARERRWSDIVAVYDARLGPLAQLASTDPGARKFRVSLGPLVALALKKTGRDREAVQLAVWTAEDAEVFLKNRHVPRDALVEVAGAEALLGKRLESLAHLEQAFAKGWRMDTQAQVLLRQNPLFATLRNHPRFERLTRVQEAHWAKERRQIEALGLF